MLEEGVAPDGRAQRAGVRQSSTAGESGRGGRVRRRARGCHGLAPKSCNSVLPRWCKTGRGQRRKRFEKLGISAQDLIDKSPEDMLLTVVAALQNVTNEADRKFLADELLGGSI